MNARRREFFRPLVESLEPRRLLACEVLFQDGKLTILGDSSDNTIEVFVARQGIHVTCDGVAPARLAACNPSWCWADRAARA